MTMGYVAPTPNNVVQVVGFGSTPPTDQLTSGGQRMWPCDYCDKTFNRHSTYVVHLRTHTGEKPFACSYEGCGRDFAVRSNLNRHVRVTHQGEAEAEAEAEGEDEEMDEG